MRNGFSVVEVILAAGLFAVFGIGVVALTVQGLEANRVAVEENVATQFAVEGLEAARSIRNQNYFNLLNSTGTGATVSGGVWTFLGSNNTFDKYTRVITVTDVYRDGAGNIVSTGGTLDPNTKKVTSTVTWNYIDSTGNKNISLAEYFSNWRATSGPPSVTCAQYCASLGSFTTGTCRQNNTQCTNNGETYESGGDVYCPGGSQKACCCL